MRPSVEQDRAAQHTRQREAVHVREEAGAAGGAVVERSQLPAPLGLPAVVRYAHLRSGSWRPAQAPAAEYWANLGRRACAAYPSLPAPLPRAGEGPVCSALLASPVLCITAQRSVPPAAGARSGAGCRSPMARRASCRARRPAAARLGRARPTRQASTRATGSCRRLRGQQGRACPLECGRRGATRAGWAVLTPPLLELGHPCPERWPQSPPDTQRSCSGEAAQSGTTWHSSVAQQCSAPSVLSTSSGVQPAAATGSLMAPSSSASRCRPSLHSMPSTAARTCRPMQGRAGQASAPGSRPCILGARSGSAHLPRGRRRGRLSIFAARAAAREAQLTCGGRPSKDGSVSGAAWWSPHVSKSKCTRPREVVRNSCARPARSSCASPGSASDKWRQSRRPPMPLKLPPRWSRRLAASASSRSGSADEACGRGWWRDSRAAQEGAGGEQTRRGAGKVGAVPQRVVPQGSTAEAQRTHQLNVGARVGHLAVAAGRAGLRCEQDGAVFRWKHGGTTCGETGVCRPACSPG